MVRFFPLLHYFNAHEICKSKDWSTFQDQTKLSNYPSLDSSIGSASAYRLKNKNGERLQEWNINVLNLKGVAKSADISMTD